MKRIVFAAPEKIWWRYVINELKEGGFEVAVCTNADVVLEEVSKDGCVGLMIDQILPPGKTFSRHETRGGLTTGSVVATHLLKERPELPVLIFGPNNKIPDAPTGAMVIHMNDLKPSKALAIARQFERALTAASA